MTDEPKFYLAEDLVRYLGYRKNKLGYYEEIDFNEIIKQRKKKRLEKEI